MNGIKTLIGHTGMGNATDKEAGHNPVAQTSLDPEQQKVSGVIPAASVAPIQFIYEVNDYLAPTIQINAGAAALVSIKMYACNDRLCVSEQDQTESADYRAAHWVEITGSYLVFGANGANAALTSTAAVISSLLLFPSSNLALGFRPAWIRIVFTPSAAQPADALDVFAHGTES